MTEGNDHSDWELWEDSVVSLDSRMQGLMPSTKIYDEPERPSEYQDLDAYSTVRKQGSLTAAVRRRTLEFRSAINVDSAYQHC